MNGRIQPLRFRNALHNHPMLRKGGVHSKTNKALRRTAKQALQRRDRDQYSD